MTRLLSAFPAGICYDSEFGCSRGNCVPSSARCDGSKDCADGEDEIACSECFIEHPASGSML